jgi:hypothetical protein
MCAPLAKLVLASAGVRATLTNGHWGCGGLARPCSTNRAARVPRHVRGPVFSGRRDRESSRQRASANPSGQYGRDPLACHAELLHDLIDAEVLHVLDDGGDGEPCALGHPGAALPCLECSRRPGHWDLRELDEHRPVRCVGVHAGVAAEREVAVRQAPFPLPPPRANVEEQGQALPAVAWWIRLIWHLDEPLHAQTNGLQSIEVALKRPMTAREGHA